MWGLATDNVEQRGISAEHHILGERLRSQGIAGHKENVISNNLGQIANVFKTNSTAFEKATQGVPAEKWLEQPGTDSNHLTWIVGHAVVHRALAAKILGSEWSAPWENLFARSETGVAGTVSRCQRTATGVARGVREIERCFAEGLSR
jgi:hypothetical protein